MCYKSMCFQNLPSPLSKNNFNLPNLPGQNNIFPLVELRICLAIYFPTLYYFYGVYLFLFSAVITLRLWFFCFVSHARVSWPNNALVMSCIDINSRQPALSIIIYLTIFLPPWWWPTIAHSSVSDAHPRKQMLHILLLSIYQYIQMYVNLFIVACITVLSVEWAATSRPLTALIARFMGLTWGPPGADRTQVGPMLAPWTLLSGGCFKSISKIILYARVVVILLTQKRS